MKILYFTTSMSELDFPSFQKSWKVSLNPSNQNFHNKLIRSLAINNDVEVFSLRPFSRSRCTLKRLKSDVREVSNITYHYLKVSSNPFYRYHVFMTQTNKIMKSLDKSNSVIFADTINPKTIELANAMGKKYHLPVIGICTDSPSNISGTRRSYTLNLLRQAQNLAGYLALTSSLCGLFNNNNKPCLVIEGLVENDAIEKPIKDERYFFFGGALMEKYGIYDLIAAFKRLEDGDIKFYICGHHYDLKRINDCIKEDPRIYFLGTLPVKEVLQYEVGAIANINPRPFSEDLDRFSIPSKTLEYLASGRPTISVRNTILQQDFADCAIWCQSAKEDDLYEAMKKVLVISGKEQKALGQKAQKKVQELYSLKSINQKINGFLAGFSK